MTMDNDGQLQTFGLLELAHMANNKKQYKPKNCFVIRLLQPPATQLSLPVGVSSHFSAPGGVLQIPDPSSHLPFQCSHKSESLKHFSAPTNLIS